MPKELYDKDLERAMLGAVLMDPVGNGPKLYDLDPGIFHDERHRAICKAIQERSDNGQPFDIVLIGKDLNGKFPDMPIYLTGLINDTPSMINADSYLTELVDLKNRRDTLAWANRLATAAYNEPDKIAGLLTKPPTIAHKEPTLLVPRKTRWTAQELLAADFPEPTWVIPDLVPEGLVIVGGRPKVGKSWLALQMAVSVASGGKFFDRDVDQGKVLFIAMEDNPRRLQSRLNKIGVAGDIKIETAYEWRQLNEGGADDLIKEIQSNQYKLIIVDPLNRLLLGLDQKDSPQIPAILAALQNETINQNTTIEFVDHTRKPNAFNPDPIDDILNMTGKTSIADVTMAIYKTQGKAGAELKGRGRDIEDIDLAISWDPTTCCWQYDGKADDIKLGEAQADIIDALGELGRSQAAKVAKAIERDRGNVFRNLQKLCDMGKVKKEVDGGNIYYTLL
jgi:hypothetical protein